MMAYTAIPAHDQAIQQHRHWCRALDGPPSPALWLLEAQVLLALVESDFHTPSRSVPGQDLLRRGVHTRGIKRFAAATSGQSLHGHDSQGTLRQREHTRYRVTQPGQFMPPVNAKFHAAGTLVEHSLGRRELRS